MGVDTFEALGIPKDREYPPFDATPPTAAREQPRTAPPSSAPSGGADIFDALGIPKDKHYEPFPSASPQQGGVPPGKRTGYGANIGARVIDAAAGFAGGPADLAAGAINTGIGMVNTVRTWPGREQTQLWHEPPPGMQPAWPDPTPGMPRAEEPPIPAPKPIPTIQRPIYGSQHFKESLFTPVTGMNPDEVVPADLGEALAGGAASAVVGAVAPWAVARMLPQAAGAAGAVQRAFGGMSLPATAGVGAVGGAAGRMAEEAVPPEWKPLANVVGSGVGMAAVGGLGALAGKGADVLGMMGIARRTTVGDQRMTGAQGRRATAQFRQAIGDEGQAALETAANAEARAAGLEPRVAQLEAVMADPAVSSLDKARAQVELNDLHTELNRLRPERIHPFPASGKDLAYQRTTAEILQTPEAIEFQRGLPAKAFNDQNQANSRALINAARGLAPEGANAQSVGVRLLAHLDELQGRVSGAIPEGGARDWGQLGGDVRGVLNAQYEPVRARESALWRLVDPEKKLVLPSGELPATARKIAAEISPTAKVDGQEMALLERAASLQGNVPFWELTQIRRDINAALPRLNREAMDVRRLTLLKRAIDDSITSAVDGQVAREAEAVAAGRMAPTETIEARVKRRLEEWSGRQQADIEARAGGGYQPGAASVAGGPEAPIPGAPGAEFQARGRPGSTPGNQGLPEGAQPLTSEDASRLYTALGATAERKELYGKGGVGDILERAPFQGYRVQDAAAAKRIFTGTRTEPAEVDRFITASGGVEKVAPIARQVLTKELYDRGIITPDGQVNGKRLTGWLNHRGDTLNRFPGMRDEFAQLAGHATTLNEFERSVAAQLIGHERPADVIGRALASPNKDQAFRELWQLVRGDTSAENGLKSILVDHVIDRFVKDGEFQKEAFRTFVKENGTPLKIVLGGQGRQMLDAIGAELGRAVEMPRAHATSGHGDGHTALSFLITERVAEGISKVLSLKGTALLAMDVSTIAATYLARKLYQHGITKSNDILLEMFKNPAFGREMLVKFKGNEIPSVIQSRIVRALTASAVSEPRDDRSKPAPGVK